MRKQIKILLIEDNEDDIFFMEEALKESKFVVDMDIVMDGEEAMNYLNKLEDNNEISVDLILLDLNLPRIDGFEILKQLSKSDDLNLIPVIVLTTSDDYEDVLKSYKLQANAFITKPVDFEKMIEIVNAINDFWFTIVRYP